MAIAANINLTSDLKH